MNSDLVRIIKSYVWGDRRKRPRFRSRLLDDDDVVEEEQEEEVVHHRNLLDDEEEEDPDGFMGR